VYRYYWVTAAVGAKSGDSAASALDPSKMEGFDDSTKSEGVKVEGRHTRVVSRPGYVTRGNILAGVRMNVDVIRQELHRAAQDELHNKHFLLNLKPCPV